MGNIITDLRQKFRSSDVCMQFIYINVAVFVVVQLSVVCCRLFNQDTTWVYTLEIPSLLPIFGWQPWSLFTYMFMHAGLLHLLFNMLWLYCFGRLFLWTYSARHFRGLYLLGGLVGAFTYLAAYALLPFFNGQVGWLLGASAAVLAIVIATAIGDPERPMTFFLLGTIKLKYVALIMIVSDMLFITSDNAGGHVAHLGGALAGWIFAYGIRSGKYDATSWINKILDFITDFFSSDKKEKKARMKVNYGNRTQDYEYNARKRANEEEIDHILDKLKKSGYDSLTTEEKKRLFDASKR